MLKKAASILPILITVVFVIVVIITFIDRRTEPEPPAPTNAYDFYIVDGKVNINTVNADMLQYLLRLDKKTALQIVAYREENGAFRDIRDLLNVKRMTEELFDQIAEDITVGDVK
jgi:competence ComEA-like helix-hairpin-helix protein